MSPVRGGQKEKTVSESLKRLKMDMFDSRSALPMLIGVESGPFDDEAWIYELKLDGERTLAYLDRNGTLLVNKRSVRLLAKFPELATLNDSVSRRCILDGELIIVDENGHPDFEEVKRRSLMTRTMAIERAAAMRPAVFVAFDILYDTDREIIHLPLMERKAILADVVRDNAQIRRTICFNAGNRFLRFGERKASGRHYRQTQGQSLFARQTDERLGQDQEPDG